MFEFNTSKRYLTSFTSNWVTFCRIALGFGLAALASGCSSYSGQVEDVSFIGGGGIELRGSIITPKGRTSPIPAIVLLHGAEPATRDRMIYKITANVFLERGMAVLAYDKRGAGESGGNHDEATYAELVEDAIAAVRFLKNRQDVDPDNVGILGISESGWLTPEIAERSGNVAFVINKVGAAVSVRDTIAWEVYNEILDEGASAESANQQIEIYRRIWEYRISPTSGQRARLTEVLSEWSGRSDSQLPTTLKDMSESYIADLRYDPTPYLERAQTPMLYLYGSEDVNIPTDICIARLDELAAAGRPFKSYVFEDEGHELGGFSALPPFYKFADHYAKILGDFAEKHVSK